MTQVVSKNKIVCLIDDHSKKYLVDTAGKTDKIKGIGVLNPQELIGQKYGTQISIGSKKYWILQPSILDKLQAIKRRAQIILPQDAAHIIINCGIESGHTVLEAGIGSGSLTIALASIVKPTGKVISYDNREEFIVHAQKNLQQAGLLLYTQTKLRDVTEGIQETGLDSVILDIPNPWQAIPPAWEALKIGGYICTFSPLISQIEKTVVELKKYPFINIHTQEQIKRDLIVSTWGTRPSFHMLGHTGYLTFARKVLTIK